MPRSSGSTGSFSDGGFDDDKMNPGFIIGFLVGCVLLIYIVVKIMRWFWKVEQQLAQVKALNDESAKTADLISKVVN